MSRTFREYLLKAMAGDIRKLRTERGMSLTDIALMTDLSIEVVNKIENGGFVSYKNYRKLLTFYGKRIRISIVDLS